MMTRLIGQQLSHDEKVFVLKSINDKEQNISAWEEFAPHFLSMAVISQDEVHYGFCIAGERELCLLPDLEGKAVLDVGCGSGENCIALSQLGASVVGIEPSTPLYKASLKNILPASNINILNETWASTSLDDTSVFDLVLFVGSSEYITLDFIFFEKLNRLTRPGSTVIIARMHPFWTTLYLHENDTEVIRSYFDSGREDYLLYGNNNTKLIRYHYGVGDILEKFSKNGYRIEKLSEPQIVSPEKAPFYISGCYSDNNLFDRLKNIPMTIIFRFIREA
jgi:SAM-dependent methyltransferase